MLEDMDVDIVVNVLVEKVGFVAAVSGLVALLLLRLGESVPLVGIL
jgi:hypothetical protein